MKDNTPRVYALAGIKGGIAKTATALTLARVMAGQGRRVAVIDHDPQGSCTSYLLPDIGPEDITGTALELIQGKPAPILPSIIDRVDCLPRFLPPGLRGMQRRGVPDINPGISTCLHAILNLTFMENCSYFCKT